MIGVFDSGHGGLTVFQALLGRFPTHSFVYLGDHAHAPYGQRPHAEIVTHTSQQVEALFRMGCKLVILACNTATAVVLKTLQHEVCPTRWPDRKVLGLIAPTVEAATQTPWYVKKPVFPQRNNTDTYVIFGTPVTIASGVYHTEIAKRCPNVNVVTEACPTLAAAIEEAQPIETLAKLVKGHVDAALATLQHAPEWAILGCTHYPLVAPLFRAALPPSTRLLAQPTAVADALEDYLQRHPDYDAPTATPLPPQYLTTGNPITVNETVGAFMPHYRGLFKPIPQQARQAA